MPNLYGDLTEEELRSQSEQFGDMEWEAEVASEMGPFGESEVVASRARNVPYPKDQPDYNLSGVYFPEESREEYREGELAQEADEEYKGRLDRTIGKYEPVFTAGGLDAEKEIRGQLSEEEPSFFMFGAEGNDRGTAAHELRHIALESIRKIPRIKGEVGQLLDSETKKKRIALDYLKNNIPSRGSEEKFNHDFDAYRNTSVEDAWRTIKVEFQENGEVGTSLADPDVFKTTKARVQKKVHKTAEKFSNMEAAAQTYEGIPPPKNTTWKEHYLKLFEGRQRVLSSALDNHHGRLLEQR